MDLTWILAFESPALDLDVTLFIQLGFFILLLIALHRFVLQPYFRAYDAREALTKGAQDEARALEEEATRVKSEYEKVRQAAFHDAETERRAEVAQASVAASEVVARAREEVQAGLAAKTAELDGQLSEARRKAAPEIESISAHIANKILV